MNRNFRELEKSLKRVIKRKVSFNHGIFIAFLIVGLFCFINEDSFTANTRESGLVYGKASEHMPNQASNYGWTISQEMGKDGIFSTGETRDKRISIGVESEYENKTQGLDKFTGKTLDDTTGGVNASVSFGSSTYKRQLKNIENGIDDYDAVNVSQLKAVASAIKGEVTTQVAAAKTEVVAGTNVTVGVTTGTEKQTIYTVNADGTTVSSGDTNYIVVNKGSKNTTTNITDYSIDLSQTVKDKIDSITTSASEKETVVAGSTNLTVDDTKKNSTGGKEFTVDLAKDININSVTTGDTKINTNGVTINNGPSMTKDGIDAGGNKITNVAPGTEPNDAVNVSQLKGVEQNINNRMGDLDSKVNRGLAGVAALSGIEFMDIGINQATIAAAVGGYKGTHAVAVGMEAAPTENTRVNAKISLTPGSRVDSLYSVGAAYRFNWK